MSKLTANGVALYYEEHGAGQPILCIHGTSGSALLWGDATEQLARYGRAIVYDRRGCFRSDRPAPYTTNVSQHADDAAALIEALDAAPAVVVGRSYGGDTALDLALRYPGLVRALVLLEPAVLSLSPATAAWATALNEKVQATAATQAASVAEVFLREVLGDAMWEAFSQPAKDMFTGNGPAIEAELKGGFLDVTPGELAGVSHPTLLLAAQDSPPAFAHVARLMAQAMPNATLDWVDGGHYINPAHPAVLRFLDSALVGVMS